MKKLILLCTLVLVSFSFVSAQTVSVSKKGFLINKVSISSGWLYSACTDAIGGGAREREGYNYTHTYDSKGVVLFEKMNDKKRSGTINEVQFHFYVPEQNNVTPKSNFTGSAKVDKLSVSRSTTAADVAKGLKKWTLGDSYMEHNYRYSNKGIYIYFQFNEAETELQKISVGPDRS